MSDKQYKATRWPSTTPPVPLDFKLPTSFGFVSCNNVLFDDDCRGVLLTPEAFEKDITEASYSDLCSKNCISSLAENVPTVTGPVKDDICNYDAILTPDDFLPRLNNVGVLSASEESIIKVVTPGYESDYSTEPELVDIEGKAGFKGQCCRTLFSEFEKFDEKIETQNFQVDVGESSVSNLTEKTFIPTSHLPTTEPSIGVFWDIENCRVPKNMSAATVVQAIRQHFFKGFREAEFMCVCDVTKEASVILQELNDAQVNVIHVGSGVKNAADDKLLQSLRRFAGNNQPDGSAVVLISGDANFATALYDLRYRNKLKVILVHNSHASDTFKMAANEIVDFSEITQQLPARPAKKPVSGQLKSVLASNLPETAAEGAIRKRLQKLVSNLGGKVGKISNGTVKLDFQTPENASRAKKRLENEDVYGSKLFVTFNRRDKSLKSRKTEKCGSNLSMTDSGTFNLNWSENNYTSVAQSDGFPVQSPYSAFKNYSKDQSQSGISEPDSNSMDSFWCSGAVGMSGTANTWNIDRANLAGSSSQNESSQDSTPLHFYNQKSDHIIRKSRPQFRISSPPNYPVNLPSQGYDQYGIDNRNKSSPLVWNISSSQSKAGWVETNGEQSNPNSVLSLGNMTLSDTPHESASSTVSLLSPVELQITNLDQTIDVRAMKYFM